MMLPEPDAAEAPQNPIRQTDTESGLEQLSDGTHDTALAPTQPAVEPVAAQPLTSAPHTLSSESAPRADEQDMEATEPAPQAGQPYEGDARLAKPPLF